MSDSAGLLCLLPRVLKEMSTAMKAIAFYPTHHPAVVSSLDRAAATFSEGLVEGADLRIGVADSAFLFGGQPLAGEDRALAGFAAYLSRRGVGALLFHAPVGSDSLKSLLEVIAMDPGTLRSLGGPARCLSGRGWAGVAIEE